MHSHLLFSPSAFMRPSTVKVQGSKERIKGLQSMRSKGVEPRSSATWVAHFCSSPVLEGSELRRELIFPTKARPVHVHPATTKPHGPPIPPPHSMFDHDHYLHEYAFY